MKRTDKCVKCSKRTMGKTNGQFLCRKCRHIEESMQHTENLLDMNLYDFGWLVGFVEGEGCFYCKDSKCKLKNGGIYCYPLAGFALMATDKDVMVRFSNLLHLPLKGPYYKNSKKDRKVVWSVQVTGHVAVALMKVFYEHLSERRQEQIDEATEWQLRGKFEVNSISQDNWPAEPECVWEN